MSEREIREYIAEERDRRAVRSWYGNIAFFTVIAVAVVFLALVVLGTLVA